MPGGVVPVVTGLTTATTRTTSLTVMTTTFWLAASVVPLGTITVAPVRVNVTLADCPFGNTLREVDEGTPWTTPGITLIVSVLAPFFTWNMPPRKFSNPTLFKRPPNILISLALSNPGVGLGVGIEAGGIATTMLAEADPDSVPEVVLAVIALANVPVFAPALNVITLLLDAVIE